MKWNNMSNATGIQELRRIIKSLREIQEDVDPLSGMRIWIELPGRDEDNPGKSINLWISENCENIIKEIIVAAEKHLDFRISMGKSELEELQKVLNDIEQ